MKRCRECQTTELEAEFKSGANLCKNCHASYMKEYRKKHRQRINKSNLEWKNRNRNKHRETSRRRYHSGGKVLQKRNFEKTIRCFLSKQISSIKSKSSKPGPHDPKDSIRRMFDLDNDYICEMWEAQGGRCAITNVPMVYKFGCLNSVSIDRIDNSLGHVKGNIQLICLGINRLKNKHSNEEVSQFLKELSDGAT